MAREPILSEALLQAEDVGRCRLLPEGPLGIDHAWARLWKFNTLDMMRGVAAHISGCWPVHRSTMRRTTFLASSWNGHP
jgi:hypothetical protein